MGFETGRRIGRVWDDAKKLDGVIRRFPFHTTGKNERDFEMGFATTLTAGGGFNSQVITQIDKSTTVGSVYCFGKKHRPDMTLGNRGVAVELKYVTYDGLREAIGQGFLYRLKYKYVFLVLIVSEERRSLYYDLAQGEEKDLADTLEYLARKMNIFSYVVPAFVPKPGTKSCYGYFDDPAARDWSERKAS